MVDRTNSFYGAGQFARYICVFLGRFLVQQQRFMAANWVEIAVVDYIIKILISLLLFIPLYGLLLSALLRFMGAPATAKPSI